MIVYARMPVDERAATAEPLATRSEAGAKGGRGKKADANGKSFGSNAADYLTARIARDRPDILEQLLTQARIQQAAMKTTGEVLPNHRPQSGSVQFAQLPTEQRASQSGVSRRTQIKLDRLARDFPELHQRVVSGELVRGRTEGQAHLPPDVQPRVKSN